MHASQTGFRTPFLTTFMLPVFAFWRTEITSYWKANPWKLKLVFQWSMLSTYSVLYPVNLVTMLIMFSLIPAPADLKKLWKIYPGIQVLFSSYIARSIIEEAHVEELIPPNTTAKIHVNFTWNLTNWTL